MIKSMAVHRPFSRGLMYSADMLLANVLDIARQGFGSSGLVLSA